MVDMAKGRFDALKSAETNRLAERLAKNVHDLVDLAANVAVQVPDVLNRVMAFANALRNRAAPPRD